MIALVRKEVTASLPVWIGAALMLALWVVDALGDDVGVDDPWGAFRHAEGIVELLVLFAFATGHWLAASDARDGSLGFLDGLPVRRPTVFFVKATVGFGPLALLLAGWAATFFGLLWLTGSAYTADPTTPALQYVATVTATTLGFYGLGLGLSWLAELGWGAFTLLMFALLLTADIVPAFADWVPGLRYPGVESLDGVPSYDLRPMRMWAVIGAAATLVSAWRFVGWDTTRTLDLGCALRALLYGAGALLLLLVALSTALALVGTSWTRLLSETRRAHAGPLVFLYEPAREGEARGLIGAAPGVDLRMRRLFGVEESLRLDVELLGTGLFHSGRFNGGKIRLAQDAGPDVFAHELAHAYSFALAGGALHDRSDATAFFTEGVAEWAQGVAFPNADHEEQAWWLAAAIRKSDQADFDELVDASQRLREHDVAQIYPLGHTLVLVIADLEGDDAPPCLLRAVRDTAREDLAGLALWYRLFARCDADLDGALGAWRRRLDAIGEVLPPLPDLGARVDGSGAQLLVEDRATTHLDLYCRFRSMEDQPIGEMRQTTVYDGACDIPIDRVRGRTVEYQLGYYLPGAGLVFEPWTEAELRRGP